jgi:hypothetical protein
MATRILRTARRSPRKKTPCGEAADQHVQDEVRAEDREQRRGRGRPDDARRHEQCECAAESAGHDRGDDLVVDIADDRPIKAEARKDRNCDHRRQQGQCTVLRKCGKCRSIQIERDGNNQNQRNANEIRCCGNYLFLSSR